MPHWLVSLLADYALVCPFLNVGEEFREHGELFSFWPPAVLSRSLSDSVFQDEIIAQGFIPLSDTSDGTGNLWLTGSTGDSLSPVYLFDLSDMERKLAADNLAHLLSGCKIDRENWRNH